MRRFPLLATFAVLGLAVGLSSVSGAADVDGKTLFANNKCNLCHGIQSQSIAKTSEKMKGEDLSDVGSKAESLDWVKAWLLQQKEKDGKKHQKKFNGTDAELDTLAKWIMSLKKS